MTHTTVSIQKRNSDSELFTPITLQTTYIARPSLITCLVCKRGGYQSVGHPKLCQLCADDLPAARCHVDSMLHHVEARVERTMDAWQREMEGMDVLLYARWQRYKAASEASDPKASIAEDQARTDKNEPLLNLIRLWLEYQDSAEAYTEMTAWVNECAGVLV